MPANHPSPTATERFTRGEQAGETRFSAQGMGAVAKRTERVYIETDRHRIMGLLTLARDGYRSRISDLLNATERDFISLTDVTVELIGGDGPGTEHPFMALSRHKVVFAIPASGFDAGGEARPAPSSIGPPA